MIHFLGTNTAREIALVILFDLGMQVACERYLRSDVASGIYSQEQPESSERILKNLLFLRIHYLAKYLHQKHFLGWSRSRNISHLRTTAMGLFQS
jgi:hypothetical protein